MDFADVLKSFGEKAGIAPLTINPRGLCRLMIDGEIAVDIEHQRDDPTAYLSTSVGIFSRSLPADVMHDMLVSNLFGRDTGGGALAIDEDAGDVILWRALLVKGLDADLLEAAIGQLVEAAKVWLARLAEPDEFASLERELDRQSDENLMIFG